MQKILKFLMQKFISSRPTRAHKSITLITCPCVGWFLKWCLRRIKIEPLFWAHGVDCGLGVCQLVVAPAPPHRVLLPLPRKMEGNCLTTPATDARLEILPMRLLLLLTDKRPRDDSLASWLQCWGRKSSKSENKIKSPPLPSPRW